jgi:hypothetical protein
MNACGVLPDFRANREILARKSLGSFKVVAVFKVLRL